MDKKEWQLGIVLFWHASTWVISRDMFAVEREAFCLNEKLDEKWQNLAKSLIKENVEEKEDLLNEFKEKIASNIELVKLADSDLVKDEAFLIR